MDNESIAALKLDRRLLRRRNWITQEQLHEALEELPDVSDKVLSPGEAPEIAKPHTAPRALPAPPVAEALQPVAAPPAAEPRSAAGTLGAAFPELARTRDDAEDGTPQA